MRSHRSSSTEHHSLSVVLAARNEEANIARCLASVKDIASEIIVMDEKSEDKTAEIAKSYGARVYEVEHQPIFHKTKQKALEAASGDWILQLDADEVVTPELAEDVKSVVKGKAVTHNPKLEKLFSRHQRLIEQRDGPIGTNSGLITGYFIPRVNYFLGKPLIHAGVYPDPSIRLVRRGKAHFTGKSVHDIMQIKGRVSWLYSNLEHHDSPTLSKYFKRLNRYTDLKAEELKSLPAQAGEKTKKNLWNLLKYSLILPTYYFLLLYFRHKGFLDGARGFLWSFLSAMHFPIAYFKYILKI